MNDLITWVLNDLSKAIPIISAALGLLIGGAWTVITFFHKIYSEREKIQFDRYRMLVDELNVGKKIEGDEKREVYVDFQLNSVYEMRFYRKYYPRSEKIIEGLIPRWKESKSYNDDNVKEIRSTLTYIKCRKSLLSYLFFKILCLIWPIVK